jgi:glycosyltransferase involved in cell wall biosynthesis
MTILFLARATLYSVPGGDTVQILSTAKYLKRLGVGVDVKLVNEKVDYNKYDLLHIFNIIRPADFLSHIKNSRKPYVVSTIFVDYNDYQKEHAQGVVSLLSRYLTSDQIEYAKAMARWVKNGEAITSSQYFLKGHKRSIQDIARGAACLLPNSESEYKRFVSSYQVERPYKVIYYGVDPDLFPSDSMEIPKPDPLAVICASRIEGKKNILNLIKALNNTSFRLKIIGKPAPNHLKYYDECKRIAAGNVSFADFIPQVELADYYISAKVHALPSWNETCGLSSLEAAYYNCNLVITDKGDTQDYFGRDAWYCDPRDPESIYDAVAKASSAPVGNTLKNKIAELYNWRTAAKQTLSVYKDVLEKTHSTHEK